jgi:multidrug transporter EmrE-like cation transporter
MLSQSTIRRADGAPPLSALAITGTLVAAIFGLAGSVGWVFYVVGLKGLPGQDWMVFYTAARAYLDGNLALIFNGEWLTAALNHRFADWMAIPLHLQPWVYPPSFLLLFLPFGVLPAEASFALFQGVGFIAAVVAVLYYTKSRDARQLLILSLVLCPAVPFNVMTGQNAFFTIALLVGGFGLISRHPILGGALLGVLTYKPQFCLMVPIALVAAGQWRALASAAAVSLGIALASAAVFGVDLWRAWLELVTGGEQYRGWAATGRSNGISVYACAKLLGAPAMLANLLQIAAFGAAAGCVYRAFRRSADHPLSFALLLAATMLAAPHASAADAMLLGLSASLFLATATAGKLRSLQAVLAIAVWLCPFLNPPSVFPAGAIVPLLVLLFIGCIFAVIRSTDASGSAAPVLVHQRAF